MHSNFNFDNINEELLQTIKKELEFEEDLTTKKEVEAVKVALDKQKKLY